jgi:biopolymer transport protein ExbB/TolQ
MHEPNATSTDDDEADVRLNWSATDIEQRLGFTGGSFTRVNGIVSLLVGCGLAVAFYGSLVPAQGSSVADLFTQRGPIPYAIVFFAAWALAILLLKWRKLALQRRALSCRVIPSGHDFVLSAATVDQVLARIHALVDDPKRFLLFNRIVIALSNLRNLGRVSDVDEILRSQADQEESSMETSYALVAGFVWMIPVLGFIGTVLGLSQAIGGFGQVLGNSADLDAVATALRHVTAGLSVAFDTTLIGLVAAITIQILLTMLKKSEEEFLDACSEYCLRHVVGRLRVMPFEVEVE